MIAPVLIAAALAVQGPQVELWTDRGHSTVYHRGDRVRVYVRADQDAYLTILRVDTDGRVRVLFPENPWEDNYARGRQAYEIRPHELRYAFAIDEYPGLGYVFAIATLDPFDYRAIVRGDHWDYAAIAAGGRITGDPYVAVQDLVDLIVPVTYDAYGYDLATYYVERVYDYPRFLCYDCHSYVAYTAWDPYYYSCNRFRIVVYDDPYYYPARVYAANRVVYRRVARIEPRYVFKDRSPTEAYVVRVRQRPADPASRRADERGVTGRDLGPAGRVAAPVRDTRTAVPLRPEAPGAAPARRPDPVSRPVPLAPVPDRRPAAEPAAQPRRLPERETPAPTPGGRSPSTGGVLTPVPERSTPRLVPERADPRAVPERAGGGAVRTSEPERPKLERREPPERAPATRPTPPPGAKPETPAKKPEAPPAKKPEAPPPRRKGGS